MTIYKGRLINQATQDIMYPQTSYDMIDGTPESLPANGGNADTATKLATARTINGTSFNGSANITTANWGTARTLTIGSSAKSVNGSANVSWSLSEIGAAATSHNHSASNITSGTLPIARGGTGATTAAGVLTNLGITATATELNKLSGISYNVQEVLNSALFVISDDDDTVTLGNLADWVSAGKPVF